MAYQFDYGNRLRSVSGEESGYVYDANGRRVLQTDSTGTIASFYDSAGKLIFQRSRDGTTHDYLYLGGKLVAIRDYDTQGIARVMRYQHTDALGSIIRQTDKSGAEFPNTGAIYDAWGGLHGVTAMDGPGFTGHVQDADTGLVYMQQRYYDPEAGRFLSIDPVGANSTTGANLDRYWYAKDNPYRYTDPDGRYTCEKSVCAAVGRYVAALRQSYANLRARPGNYSQASRVHKAISAIGLKGEKGPHYVAGHLKGESPANTDQKGTTTIDLGKNISPQIGAAAIAHEAQHDIDARVNGVAGDTSNRASAKQQFNKAETNAYKTTNAVMDGFGVQVKPTKMQSDIDFSVTQDLKIWDGNHSVLPSSSN